MTLTENRRELRAGGLWESPISPAMLAQGLRLGDSYWDGDGHALVWLEGRSDRGVLVMASGADPAPRDLTSDLSVRALVGYGGGDFTTGHGTVVFSSGGRLWRQPLNGGKASPITPAFGAVASPQISPDGRRVLFVHSYEDQDVIGAVDLNGSCWPVKLSSGRDFYMQPRWSPDGSRVAWVAWDHPNMPWDGTELWVAECELSNGMPRLSGARMLAGGPAVAVFQPEFTAGGGALLYVSDESGHTQLYRHDIATGERLRLTDGTGEYGEPAWSQGQHSYAPLPDGHGLVAIRSEGGYQRLQYIDAHGGGARDVGGDTSAYTQFSAPAAGPAGVSVVASASDQPARLLIVEPGTGGARVRARMLGETVPRAAFSVAQPVSWRTGDADEAHGLFYPPVSERFEPAGKAPLIVLVHGGPTSQVTAGFQAQTQFFTSRGFAVLQVNYRGSTGYGRAYMLKLRGNWGLHDVEDSRSGAQYLADQGWVDPRRRVIMGGSAGGFTVLQSLVAHPGFYTAGVSLFGVSNQFTLASDTHKFEARYLDSMLGPLPEAAAVYRERSPIFHAAAIRDPLAVFQGTDDKVVPRAQSDEIVASLRARGVPHEYHIYEGEGHGWRRTDTVEKFYTSVERFLKQYVVYA